MLMLMFEVISVYNLLFRALESQTLILTANSTTAVKTYIYCDGEIFKIYKLKNFHCKYILGKIWRISE